MSSPTSPSVEQIDLTLTEQVQRRDTARTSLRAHTRTPNDHAQTSVLLDTIADASSKIDGLLGDRVIAVARRLIDTVSR